jgi:predicted transcriptional regulator
MTWGRKTGGRQREMDEPTSFTLWADKGQVIRLRHVAAVQQRTVSALIREAIEDFLEANEHELTTDQNT